MQMLLQKEIKHFYNFFLLTSYNGLKYDFNFVSIVLKPGYTQLPYKRKALPESVCLFSVLKATTG